MGHNEDYLPDGFKSSIVALAAPYVPIDGMNEKGLSLGILLIKDMASTAQDTGKIDLQTTTAVRMILDKFQTVEEAVAMFSEYDMHSSAGSIYHFQVADASEDSVIIEYIDNEMTVIHPEELYQACTNFILTPGEFYGYGTGHDRYEILMTKLEETNGILTEDEAMDLMQAVTLSLEEEAGTTLTTQWSVVYNQADLTGTISVGVDYDNLTEFALSETIRD